MDDGYLQAVSCASVSFCEGGRRRFQGDGRDRYLGRGQVLAGRSTCTPRLAPTCSTACCALRPAAVSHGWRGHGSVGGVMGRHHLAHGQGAGGRDLGPESVSCSTSKLCEAVGVQRRGSPAATEAAVTEAWNGASWSESRCRRPNAYRCGTQLASGALEGSPCCGERPAAHPALMGLSARSRLCR